MILQSLVKSADKNLDRAMDWEEFEGFGDFELVFKRWPQLWKILLADLSAGMNTCGGREGKCFPSPWTSEDLKRCHILNAPCTMSYPFNDATSDVLSLYLSGTSPSMRFSSDLFTTCSTTRISSSSAMGCLTKTSSSPCGQPSFSQF